MAFQFPASPAVNQTFTPVAGVTYRWSGTAWHLLAGPGAFITTADADTRYVNVDEAPNIQNRIINGKFAIDQRNAGAAVNLPDATLLYTLDRWAGYKFVGATGTVSVQRQAHPSRAGEYVQRATVVVAVPSVIANTFCDVGQRVEGYNLADLNFGAAGAQPFTFACEVTASISGTFPLAFRNGTGNRSYVTTYTATAGVPLMLSVTVPGDTAGTWAKDNSAAMLIGFGLQMAPEVFTPAVNTWQAGNFTGAAGCTNLTLTAGATLSLSNVRLYKGAVDFGPDRRLYAEELALCQRYYCKSYNIDVVPGTVTTNGATVVNVFVATAGNTFHNIRLPVRMRAVPTATFYPDSSPSTVGNWQQSGALVPVATSGHSSDMALVLSNTNAVTAGGHMVGHFTASAEL